MFTFGAPWRFNRQPLGSFRCIVNVFEMPLGASCLERWQHARDEHHDLADRTMRWPGEQGGRGEWGTFWVKEPSEWRWVWPAGKEWQTMPIFRSWSEQRSVRARAQESEKYIEIHYWLGLFCEGVLGWSVHLTCMVTSWFEQFTCGQAHHLRPHYAVLGGGV